MMTTINEVAGTIRRQVTKYLTDPRVGLYARGGAYILAGLVLAAAGLRNFPMPIAAALVCGCSGMGAVLTAAGAFAGYLLFWGSAGQQCVLWVALGLAATLLLGRQRQQTPLLMPALAGLAVSACGVFFQVWMGLYVPVEIYLLRVGLAGGCAWLAQRVLRGRDPVLDWLAAMLAILALGQLSLGPWWNFGILAGAAIAATGAFPGAALAGVALDLAGICPVSLTATLCLGYLVRFVPGCPRLLRGSVFGLAYLLVLRVTGTVGFYPLPALLAGGLLGVWLPLPAKTPARRGETGVVQVRLEMAANALVQAEQLLLEQRPVPVDEDGVLQRAVTTACAGCEKRSECKDSRRMQQLPTALLHKPLLSTQEIPIVCRNSGRFLAELHRAQEQLRTIGADRQRREEYRQATIQQYRFMGEYLQQLSDQLPRRPEPVGVYRAEIQVFSNRPGEDNGDRCGAFMGLRDLQYVVLCDGMGTGLGAAQEGRSALRLLRSLLTAGYTPSAALRCLNSLCALRSRAGAVTVDLLEIELDTGKGRLYKWGAAPSYLTGRFGTQKLGEPGPPPGLSVTEQQEQQHKLFLNHGERLVMVSDGVGEDVARHFATLMPQASPEELAATLLRQSLLSAEDDATVVIVTLNEAE
jgi:hypothetical protein